MKKILAKNYLILPLFILALCIVEKSAFAIATNNNAEQKKATGAAQASKEYTNASNNQNIIKKINIVGNRYIDKDTVLFHAGVKINETLSPQISTKIIKSLHESGLFTNIKTDYSNNTLTITVQEQPIVIGVQFVGNKEIHEVMLRKSLSIKQGDLYSKNSAVIAAKNFVALYNARGFHNAKVKPKIVHVDQNRVNITLEISEGKKSKIKRIQFLHNTAFPDADLKYAIASKEHTIFKLLGNSSIFNQDRLSLDVAILETKYKNAGYAKFHVLDTIVEFSEKDGGFVISYVLDEGKIYNFRNVTIDGNVPNKDELLQKSLIKTGSKFKQAYIKATQNMIKATEINRGLAFTEVASETTIDDSSNSVDVKFTVTKNLPLYIRRIIFKNNTKTLDNVIRNQIKFSEGDPYNRDKHLLSERKLENLGFFSSVKSACKSTDAPNQTDVLFSVAEKSTGSLNFKVEYAMGKGPSFSANVSENNIIGTGKSVHAELKTGQNQSLFNFGFADPYFQDKNIMLGCDVNISKETPDYNKDKNRHNIERSASVKFAYAISDDISHMLKYSLSRTDSSVDTTFSEFIKNHPSKYLTSSISNSFIYSTLNRAMLPSRGSKIELTQTLAVIGGTNQYLRHIINAEHYFPLLNDDIVLKLSGGAGSVFGINDNTIRKDDAFALGVYDVCGFQPEGIGPRDKKTNDAIGGKNFYKLALQLRFKAKNNDNLHYLVFGEGASAYNFDIPKNTVNLTKDMVHDDNFMRTAVGAGIEWLSPLGIIRIDYGVALRYKDYDRRQNLRFWIGSSF